MKKHLLFTATLACPLLLGSNVLAQTATPVLPGSGQKGATESPKKTTPKVESPAKPATPSKVMEKDTASPSSVSTIQQATEAYNAGIKALTKNDLKSAAAHFKETIRLTPGDANAQLYLGYVLLKQEQWADAATALEKAKSNVGSLDASLQPILWNNLGLAYAKTDRSSDALNAYQQALTLDAEYIDAKYNLAFAQLAQKDYQSALTNLLILRDSNPEDNAFQTTIYDGMASAYEGLNDWSNALGAYRKVVQLNVNDVESRFNFALALKKAGREDDAIRQLETLLNLRSTYTPGLSLLGDIYLSKRQWDKAATILQQYAKAAPGEYNAWFNLGVAYDHSSNFDKALAAYAKAEALDPKDPAVKNNIGRIYFKRGDYDKAVATLNNALELDAGFDDARLNLALVLMAQENWTEAAAEWKTYLLTLRAQLQSPSITDAEKMSISRRGADAHSALALCYMHSELYADARDQYKRLLATRPNDEDAKVNLALCYYHTLNYTKSVQLNREVIAANPKNAIAYNNLGVALEALNRIGEAMENYQKAVEIDPAYQDAKNNLARLNANTVKS